MIVKYYYYCRLMILLFRNMNDGSTISKKLEGATRLFIMSVFKLKKITDLSK